MTKDNIFIEQRIKNTIREILTGRVNELINELPFVIPIIEFGNYSGGGSVVPIITLSACERSEKERIIRLDAYSLTITFNLPETPDSELYCYAYSAAVEKALSEDVTIGGIADRAVITSKKYIQPKKTYCGEGCGVVIAIRVTVENEQLRGT